ncbi:MBL fold metallo-hydrolase [Frankia gtarii]|uniref:MBL fold metallo-hydrolase n=1 Tax=Frankia gtarii TaxID=2950102 RepID=UPI0034D6CE3C
MHGDHTGWTTLEDRPVFPNATYRCHAADWHHFVDGPEPDRRTASKLAPITGQVELFDTDRTLAPGIDARHTPGIDARHTPGHTPGSTIYIVSSGQRRALLLGDVAHSPVELLDAGWEAVYDTDSPAAQAARARLIDEIEADGTPVAFPHFAGLRFGRKTRASATNNVR